jgi:hypothetical protein
MEPPPGLARGLGGRARGVSDGHDSVCVPHEDDTTDQRISTEPMSRHVGMCRRPDTHPAEFKEAPVGHGGTHPT